MEENTLQVQVVRPGLHSIGNWLLVVGIAYIAIVVVMFALIAASPPPTGTVEEQLQVLATDPGMYTWGFIASLFISPVLVTLMVLFAFFVPTSRPAGVLEVVGVVFTGLYSVLVTFVYSSQFTLLPRLLAQHQMDAAGIWYFNNQDSAVWLVENLGYVVLAVGALAIGYRLLFEHGPARWLGWALWVMAFTNLVSFVGYSIQNPYAAFVLLAAAAVSLPVGIVAAVWGNMLRTGRATTGAALRRDREQAMATR